MKIIEIQAQENGSHRNQTGNFKTIPNGWAVIPDAMECENFPFGEVETEEINGIMIVTKWTAGSIPEIEEAEQIITDIERLRADIDYIAIMKGVEL